MRGNAQVVKTPRTTRRWRADAPPKDPASRWYVWIFGIFLRRFFGKNQKWLARCDPESARRVLLPQQGVESFEPIGLAYRFVPANAINSRKTHGDAGFVPA